MKIKYFFILVLFSIYSFSVGKWNIFPYNILANIKHTVKQASYESFYDDSSHASAIEFRKFGFQTPITNVQLNNKLVLNNFDYKWGVVEAKLLGKTGAAEVLGDNLWYINQNDNRLLELLGLNGKISRNGGIKSLFRIGEKEFVYVAYFDDACASARLVDLSTMEVVLQLSCLPDPSKVDLNGSGGAWLRLSDSEGLLSTGTPTIAHAGNEINQAAQFDNNFWGKVLKLSLVNDRLVVKVFSKGHRNPQGINRIDKSIFAVEHGPMGGDEINLIKEGYNYGWPLQSFGSEYDLGLINKSFDLNVKNQVPLLSFVPSIGISYINNCPKSYADYYAPNNCMAVSSLRGQAIFLIVHNNDRVLFYEKLQFNSRIRRFFVQDDRIIAVTDSEGIIIGRLSIIK
jgi:hypothetical protein